MGPRERNGTEKYGKTIYRMNMRITYFLIGTGKNDGTIMNT